MNTGINVNLFSFQSNELIQWNIHQTNTDSTIKYSDGDLIIKTVHTFGNDNIYKVDFIVSF